MKRSAYLLSFLLLGACGKYEYQGEFIGKKLSEVKIDSYTKTDADSMALACGALSAKEASLESGVPITRNFRFSVRSSDCSGEFVTTVQDVRIEDGVFKQTSGANFVFKNIETTKEGILAPVCQNGGLFTGQYDEGGHTVIVRTAENGTECPRVQGSVCLQFIKVQKNTEVIVSRELLRIRHTTGESLRGFFDWRRLSGQSADCAQTQFTTIEAALGE